MGMGMGMADIRCPQSIRRDVPKQNIAVSDTRVLRAQRPHAPAYQIIIEDAASLPSTIAEL